jgi:hypothetical protein
MTKGAESADVEDIMCRLGVVKVVGIIKADAILLEVVVAIMTDKRTRRRMMMMMMMMRIV